MNKQEHFEKIAEHWVEFEKQHAGTTQKSQLLARKELSAIKKLISGYNKASTAEAKAAKAEKKAK